MESEQFEFELSQYLDGTLSPAERAAVEERLRTEESARALLAEYQKLEGLIQESAGPLPRMRWERLAHHLADYAMGGRNYSIALYRGVELAIAASLLLTVGLWSMRWQATSQPPTTVAMAAPKESLVVDSQVASADSAAALDVAVSQPEADVATEYSDGQGVLVERATVELAGYTKIRN